MLSPCVVCREVFVPVPDIGPREWVPPRCRTCEECQQQIEEDPVPQGVARCTYCGRPATTLDHVRPARGGGRSIDGNLVPACRKCNSAKAARRVVWPGDRVDGPTATGGPRGRVPYPRPRRR